MCRSGQAATEAATDRLATAGATLEDVPELRREALELLDLAAKAARQPGAWRDRPHRRTRS